MEEPQSVVPLRSGPPTTLAPAEPQAVAASTGAPTDPSGWSILLKILVYLLVLPTALLLAVRYLLDVLG